MNIRSFMRKLDNAAPWLNGSSPVIRAAALSVFAPALVACGGDGPEPQPEIPPEPVERTVLVYMVANNNLGYAYDPAEGITDGYDNADIDEMCVAAQKGALAGNRLIVYHADYMAQPELKEVTPKGTVRTLRTFEAGVPATSAARMAEVIAETKRLSPAGHYGMVLWSHASGWLENGIAEEPPYGPSASPKSFGEDAGRRMNVTTLARVLDGEEFDYLWFDCCHMATVEVAYELRHVAGMIAGSVAELPSKGMPYDLALQYLMAVEPDLPAAAKAVFDSYDSFRAPDDAWKRTCTMSVINTAGMEQLAAASRQVFALAGRTVAFDEVQAFRKAGTYYDFGHYMQRLCSAAEGDAWQSDAHKAAFEGVENALNDVLVYQAATPWLWEGMRYDQVKIDRHSGLSTYIVNRPGGEFTSNYCNLRWWDDVASVYWTK